MKYGKEVEGRLRGILTLFIDADEFLLRAGDVALAMEKTGLGHVYISDHNNNLSYAAVSKFFYGYQVTMDVTEVLNDTRPANITIILTMPISYSNSIRRLMPDDQVKFHSAAKNVHMATMRSFVETLPSEFDDDEEIK